MEKVKPWLGEPQNTIAVLQKYGFVFQKKYGQNFLIDTRVLDRIIDCSRCRYRTGRFCCGNRTWYRYADAVSCVCCAECVCGGN